MSELLENILNENYVSAQEIFEERLGEILEKKLYEKKKMIQAEAFGGMTKADIERRKKAGFMKASDYFAALNTAKEIEKKAKSDIEGKKKKKVEEAFTGTGSGSDKELEARAKKAAGKLGAAVKGAAQARAERVKREVEKRAAKQKRASAEPGKPYVAPPKAEPKPETGKAPEVKLEPSDVKKPSGGVKKLKAPSVGIDAGDRYDAAMERAKRLERRGKTGAISRLKWSSAGKKIGAKRVASDYGKAMGGFAKGIISGLQEDTE
jgi:hypothetical protein